MTQENIHTVLAKRHDEDCLACRLVSGFGVLGIGIYLYNTSIKQKSSLSRNGILLLSLGKLSIHFCFFRSS